MDTRRLHVSGAQFCAPLVVENDDPVDAIAHLVEQVQGLLPARDGMLVVAHLTEDDAQVI